VMVVVFFLLLMLILLLLRVDLDRSGNWLENWRERKKRQQNEPGSVKNRGWKVREIERLEEGKER